MPALIATRIRLFPPALGGRSSPVDTRVGYYAPHLRVGPAGEHLGVRLVEGPPILQPGDSMEVVWELLYEGVDYSPLKAGVRFDILEGARVIGEGEVVRRHADGPGYEFVRGRMLNAAECSWRWTASAGSSARPWRWFRPHLPERGRAPAGGVAHDVPPTWPM